MSGAELVMVVKREDLAEWLRDPEPALIRENLDALLAIIETRHFFLERPVAEESPQYKQIIPYVVIRHEETFFLLKRTTKQTEARLHHKLSLGVGGHINPDTPTIRAGLQKELDEEVFVDDPYQLELLGIINDDTTAVGSVHLGAVYLLHASTSAVRIRETEKMSGELVPRESLHAQREAMESWSQIVLTAL
jgi:predicted NUDIX family phosphoesterase